MPESDPSEPQGQPNPPESEAPRPQLLAPSKLSGPQGESHVSNLPAQLKAIDWREALPFTNLFRGFGVAIHPSKLLLCVVAVLLIYGGARALDGLFKVIPGTDNALVGEAYAFERSLAEGRDFAEVREEAERAQTQRLDGMRRNVARLSDRPTEDIGRRDLIDSLVTSRDEAVVRADEAFAAEVAVEGVTDEDRRRATLRRDESVRFAYDRAARSIVETQNLYGHGVANEYYDYSVGSFNGLIASVLSLDLAGTITSLQRLLWFGPLWMFTQHAIYASILFIWSLAVLAVFGGAVARSAAVQVARDEKISLRSALRFSSGKFVSFLSAPLIPIIVIFLVGLAAALAALVVSLLGMIPGLGFLADIGIGLLVPIALIGGVIMALTFVGLIGGVSLMYPTIAAEGTDSFDALSRSFSYVFSRPWKAVFYAIVGLLYAAITFLVVRLFLWLILMMTRAAVGALTLRDAAGGNLLDTIWPKPSPSQFSYDIAFANLTWSQDIAAILVAIVVFGVLTLLSAYALSLYISMGTIIYFLLRRDVDATEPDEVYVDPADEEYAGYADVPEDPLAEPGTGDDAAPAPAQ
jgi:hypothetical protein